MKNRADKILAKLTAERQDNLQKLIKWSFKDLEKMMNDYYQAWKIFDSDVLYEKFSQVDEAIQIKKGNEEQAWDFLS
jgi:hypothetical protein